MDFSLLYFANREVTDPPEEYDLLVETARFADEHEFTALWLPERHFHPFGGAYPNPALAAAALASTTRRIRLRAGSVVLPLHDPLTVVEDWSFVDNLSRGRVDLALATGWNANDFVLAPDRYDDRRHHTLDGVSVICDLWKGKKLNRRNGYGDDVEILTYPRPMQQELNVWLTCTANPASFEQAGARGLNVLTGLLFQSVDALRPKITAYRSARERHGHDPATGRVTLMVHTFVGESDEAARKVVYKPFRDYLSSSIDLWQHECRNLGEVDRERMLDFAFERYFRTAALFGSVSTCVDFVHKLTEIGVDEVASLVDFGVAGETVLAALPRLDQVRQQVQNR
ncbi:siderophore biosynthesis protein [Longimycelium tulufanense]|uniref:Siderophore biosynthesis protein n=1 Tax=Longimycelium tulufanense TaxID=907463 RepID=A0A8J3CAL0_9PSEU|nr:MupA/Atu3671 family FMN-dependent luciferase-like monooxygenase [Longimycelium tulufanense]GGM51191.1 siderophore biosynthesis protein [Longimycelium tulufanense]